MTDTAGKLAKSLACLQPTHLVIHDNSKRHKGHAGNTTGGGHYKVFIVSECFAGLSLIRRHRLIYDTVGSLMHTDIHALSIDAKAPDETVANL